MFLTRFRSAVMAAALVASAGSPAVAAPIPAETKAPEGSAAKTKKALNEVADFAIDQRSLSDLITFVKEKGKVEVVLDTNHLIQMGMDPNQTNVTVNLKGAKLRDGLRAALAPMNLKFGVVGNAVHVTTEDALITKQMRQRVTLDGEGKPLASVLAALAADTGANIVVDPRQAKKAADTAVSLALDEVTLETAVRLTAEVAGLRAVRMGNVLFVTSEERGKALREDADGPTQPGGVNPVFPIEPGAGGGIGIGGAEGPAVQPVPAPAPPPAPADAPNAPAPPEKR
jgi:hypothetical protein